MSAKTIRKLDRLVSSGQITPAERTRRLAQAKLDLVRSGQTVQRSGGRGAQAPASTGSGSASGGALRHVVQGDWVVVDAAGEVGSGGYSVPLAGPRVAAFVRSFRYELLSVRVEIERLVGSGDHEVGVACCLSGRPPTGATDWDVVRDVGGHKHTIIDSNVRSVVSLPLGFRSGDLRVPSEERGLFAVVVGTGQWTAPEDHEDEHAPHVARLRVVRSYRLLSVDSGERRDVE
jgi:hypothetical protein